MNVKTALILVSLNLLVVVLLGRYTASELESQRTFDREIPLLHEKVKLLDESIRTELLNIINGRSINYDALSKLNAERRNEAAQLKGALNRALPDDGKLQKLLYRYEDIRQNHETMLSNVVSSRALTRNSRNYTFHLVNELSEQLFQDQWFEESKLIQRLWINTARFHIDPSFTSNQQMLETVNAAVDNLFQRLPQEYSDSVSALKQHLQTLLKMQAVTAESLTTIAEIEQDATLDDIFQRYKMESRRLADKESLLLTIFVFSALSLLVLLVYTASQMIKKTDKLSEEKNSLTQKVHESNAFLQRTNNELKSEIEQRKMVEKELRDAAIFYENCAQGVVICDADKTVLSVNHAYTAITGIPINKILARTPAIFSEQAVGAEMLASIESSLAKIGRWHGELRTQNDDGNLTYKEATVIAVANNDRVERYLIILTDIDERKRAEKVIYNQANYDELTRLPNRSLLKDRASSIIKDSRRSNKNFALLFIDVDNFKTINDNRGHAVGDEILKTIAHRLSETVREIDTVARFGGDEFIIILNDIADGQVLDDLLARLNSCMKEPVHVACDDDESFYISGSIGVAIYPNDGEDLSLLISRADMAMYKAKARGKNTYCLYDDKMNTEAQERMALEKKMRHALESNEFFLNYQPIINTQTGTMNAVEALIRWRTAEGEFISPDKFISVAEDNGLIVEIGEWVLREACQQLARWSQIGEPIRMNINISAKQLQEAQFISRLKGIIEETQINCQQVSLEITENLFLDDADGHILALLKELQQIGFSISLDDFGTGYSSLSYIKRFPLDYIKIDRSFISELIESPSDQSLVAAIIGMAKSLDKQVVAEGVETQAQLEWLKVYDCNSAQGYLISKPVGAELISERLSASASDNSYGIQ